MISTDLARATHEARQQRFLADAEAHRLHRRASTTTSGGRPGRSTRDSTPTRWRRPWSRPDGKIDRLRDSWLAPDTRAATRLAQAADLVDVPAGTVLRVGRFVYIGLDEAHAGLVVAADTPPVVLTSGAALLELTARAFEDIRHHIPALTDGLAAEPTEGRIAPTQGDRHVHHPHRTANHTRTGARQPQQPQRSCNVPLAN